MPLLSSLKSALTFNFLLVAAVPVLFLGLLNLSTVAKHQLEGVREHNMGQARSVAEEVAAFLDEVSADLRQVEQTLAATTILQPDGVGPFLAGMVRNSRFFESIYQLDADYRVVQLGVLPELQSRRADYAGIDFSGHQLFRKSGRIREATWSNTFVSLVTGEPSVTLCIPMAHGYLLGNVRLSSLGQLLQRRAVQGGREIAVVDNIGTLIAHNVADMAMQRLNFGDHPAITLAMAGQETTQEFRPGSKYYLDSVTRVPGSTWVVWVGLDMHQVLAPIDAMRNLLITFMVVAILLGAMIALLNVRRLMRPLTALGQRAAQVADGRYELSSPSSGFAEIDALAGQMASMAQAIKVREESIIINEQRFRNLVNSIDGIVWEMAYPEFRFLFVSRQAESILGYPVHDWYVDDSFWEHKIHPEDLPQAKAYCQLMTEKQEDHDFEYRMIAADGRVVWIRDLVTVVVENQRPVRLLGVMIDITSQKELLHELSRNEQNYREIFNATSDAIFVHDAASGKILDVNQAMLSMYECTREEAVAGGVAMFSQGTSPYSMLEARQMLSLTLEQGSCTFEWRSRKRSGELFWTEKYLRSAMIGNQRRILAAVRDITERKTAQAELEKYRLRLEALVRERTAQLETAQRELVKQERLAVLGQLTATVSHEIRNPLGTVANAIYLLRDGLRGKQYEHLARPLSLAERNVERCDNIISELLDFSRQRRLVKEPLEIDPWLAGLHAEQAFPEDVELDLDLAAQVIVSADPERLRRAMINVVSNALQSFEDAHAGRKMIEVKTRLADQRCEIIVRDNGAGMSREVLEQIFEPMFSTKTFGVGLGVPIIKNILESHGGGVAYQSEVGKGTTVTMWLPLADDGASHRA